jgi:shikimate 5-dehydrogenase
MVFKRHESTRVSFSDLEFEYSHPNVSKCTMFIQTTTLGLRDDDPLLIDQNYVTNHTLIDLIYHRKTKMMTHSKTSYGGIMMLIYQALKAYEIWDKKPIRQKDHIVSVVKEVLEHEFNRNTI